jgi:GNAT superfamily N-acetyltransferase
MALATWWQHDPLPALRPLANFRVIGPTDDRALARLNRLDVKEVWARRAAGHRPYVAYLDETIVAYGWVATQVAEIGELNLTFHLPSGDRYLWDFATRPEWQGRGLYPRLLQAILAQEAAEAERFWIIHAPENTPSGAGMHKAGLLPVGVLSFRPDGGMGLAATGDSERAAAGAALLGVPLVETVIAPCWCCGAPQLQSVTAVNPTRCWPPISPNQVNNCTCAIEKRPSLAV